MTVQESFDHLVETVRGYNPSANFDLIRSAFEFADKAHEGQLRKDIWTRSPSPRRCCTTPSRTPRPRKSRSPSCSPPPSPTSSRASAS